MQPKSSSLQLIAREIALEVGQCAYAPDLIEHIPGITNTVADTLSRHCELEDKFVLPESLRDADYVAPPVRNESWWQTMRP